MLIQLKNIQKTYSTKNGVTFRALSNVSTTFDGTGLVYLVGASGSGKSTLLNVIGGLDDYDSGELILAGRDMKSLKSREVDSLRNTLMGFVFQEFNLIDTLTVFENVKLALDMQSRKDREIVRKVLKEMGIEDKAKNKTKDLSGGQRQRVAIARALVKDPRIILADEPTGSLDEATSKEVINILKELSKTRLVIVVTHDIETAAQTGDRIIEMKDGKIYRDVRRRGENEVLDTSQTEFFSNTLMCVPQGERLTEEDADKINDAVEQSARKTFITVETDRRKVKAMHPNLREAVDFGKQKSDKEDSALSDPEFVPYKDVKSEMESVEFKKSRLPFLHAMRLGLNNLNYKKARLILTVVIAFVAFALFGTAQSFASYDMLAAITSTIEKDEIESVSVVPVGGNEISENDLAKLLSATDGAEYAKQYGLTFSPQGSMYYGWLLQNFDGVIETDDISELGLSALYGSSSCAGFGEAIISEFAAISLLRNGVITADTMADVVGKTLQTSSGRDFVIAGVFACDDCEKLMDSGEYNALETLLARSRDGWGQLYVKKGFVSDFGKTFMDSSISVGVEIFSEVLEKQEYTQSPKSQASFVRGGYKPSDVTPVVGVGAVESVNDIVIGRYLLKDLGFGSHGGYDVSTEDLVSLNGDPARRLVLRYGSMSMDATGKGVFAADEFRIVGITDGYDLIMHEDLKLEMFERATRPEKLRVCFGGTRVDKAVEAIYDSGFRISAHFVDNYDIAIMIMQILHHVLNGLAIGLCLLVVLLLFNFISTSIKMTKKHIGILRALGAKKSDTFKIYAIEGFIMTAFAFVLAVVTLTVGAPLLNVMLSAALGHYFSLFEIGIVVYLTMAALALAVTTVSVLIPLRKFNRITPVGAISGKE